MWPELSVAWTSRFFLWLYSRHNMGILSKRAWRSRFGGSTNPGSVSNEMNMNFGHFWNDYEHPRPHLLEHPRQTFFDATGCKIFIELIGVGLVVWQNYWVLGQWMTPWRTGHYELRLLTFGDLFGLSLYFARSHFFTDEMNNTIYVYI